MMGRSQKILKMTKRKISLRTQNQKEIQEKYRNLSKVKWERIPKRDAYPAKRTQSSGPVMWDCPFYEDKKYADNLEYLVHLQKVHNVIYQAMLSRKK